jgi:hypothetical protein
VALYKRVNALNPLNAGTERHLGSMQDSAVENLARESHSQIGDVKQLYVDEMAKLTKGAHIKNYLSIFALRHVRKILFNRSLANRKNL